MASDNILPLTGIRGIIAQKMSESLQKTAQLSFFCDIDASALVEARNRWKASGLKLGYEDLIIAALTSLEAMIAYCGEVEACIMKDSLNRSCGIGRRPSRIWM